MLSCREIAELATAYAEGRLPWADRLRFFVHVSMCRHCRLYVKQLKLTVKLVGTLPRPIAPPSPEVREALLRQFESWRT